MSEGVSADLNDSLVLLPRLITRARGNIVTQAAWLLPGCGAIAESSIAVARNTISEAQADDRAYHASNSQPGKHDSWPGHAGDLPADDGGDRQNRLGDENCSSVNLAKS